MMMLYLGVTVTLATGIFLLRAIGSSNHRHRSLILGSVVMWASAMLTATSEAPDSQNRAETTQASAAKQITNRPIEVQGDGYVSSNTCRTCHQHNYDTWYDSYHRTMTQVATTESVFGKFDNIELELAGRTYLLEQINGKYWVEMDDPERPRNNDTVDRIKRQIVMTTGSHHMQAYWLETRDGRKLMQFPFVFLKEEQRWIPSDASFLQPPRTSQLPVPGLWNMNCVRCHVTDGRPRYRPPDILDTQLSEFGIACEACHGPGERHARTFSELSGTALEERLEVSGKGIVHPARLSHERSSQVCGQCHGVSRFYDDESTKNWLDEGFQFRPGNDLTLTRFMVRMDDTLELPAIKELLKSEPTYLEDRFWSDGMVRVSGREYSGLLESACYQKGTISCTSCHRLHQGKRDPRPREVWSNDLLELDMESNAACLQCHSTYETNLQQHTNHTQKSTGSQCSNCHMPHTTYGLQKAIRSHQIDIPTVQSSLETGRPNSCNLCHLDKTLSWTSQHLSDWYDIPKPVLSKDESTIAASLLWLLTGDAGQRVLIAWSMGWEPAQETSGTNWMAPFLAQLLSDPYDAVRFVSARSLQRLPGFTDFDYDFLAIPEKREMRRKQAVKLWNNLANTSAPPKGEATLIDSNGILQKELLERLLKKRNNRRVYLNE